ncbi:reverse transcriptase domain-containing protein [Tanacetum coccineum]
MPTTRSGMTPEAIEELIAQRVAEALAIYEANQNVKNIVKSRDENKDRDEVKYATCTLQNGAMTWWNSHKRTVGTDAAYAMTWKELMKLMNEVYCPRNKIQKMESELWNFTMKGNDVDAYTQKFQELSLLALGPSRQH